MGAFAIRVTLLSPIATGEGSRPPLVMLDGLVGYGVARERFGPAASTRQPHRDPFIDLPLPLERIGPVWAASQGFCPTGRRQLALLTHINDRRGVKEPAHYSAQKQKWQAPDISARFGPVVLPIPLWVAPEMVFFGAGDGPAVLRLMQEHITFLGHKRGSGYGQVVRMHLIPLERDWSIGHWTGTDFVLHRPWPVDHAALLLAYIGRTWGAEAASWWSREAAGWPRAYLAAHPPYYDSQAHQWCFAPSEYGLAEAVSWLPPVTQSVVFQPQVNWDMETAPTDGDEPAWDLVEDLPRPRFLLSADSVCVTKKDA